MPPRARARSQPTSRPLPLSDADVALLRERLEVGKKPRVVLLVDTAVGAAGTSVPVVSFAEPPVGEFISVRLSDDVVPFSPAELGMPVRGRPAVEAVRKPPEPTPPPLATLSLDSPPYEPSGRPTPAAQRPSRLVAVPEPAPAPATSNASAPAPAPAKAASRRPARSGGVSVTLRFSGQAWTYESTRGGRRTSARPLNLAAVRAFADRLDDPSLRRDLQGAIDVCRQEAKTRAETLRAELERVEVELAELDE